jgi:hypothetical protein
MKEWFFSFIRPDRDVDQVVASEAVALTPARNGTSFRSSGGPDCGHGWSLIQIAEVRSVLFRENRPKCQNRGSVISAKHENSGRKHGEKAQIGEIATFRLPLFWGKRASGRNKDVLTSAI